jgi:putative heme-binding domain-containing protein
MTLRFRFAMLVLSTGFLSFAAAAQQHGDTASGQRVFAANCAACHGADARGGERAPNIATVRTIISLSDTDLESVVHNGLSGQGMPSFAYLGDQKIADVVAYLRILQGKGSVEKIVGDPKAGRAIFFGSGSCSNCHMVHGEGGFIAADLSNYGDGLKAEAVRAGITNPDRNLAPTSRVVEILTLRGEQVEGMARAEDPFTITVQTELGTFRTFEKSRLATLRHTTHSLMPKDYGERLSPREMEDLVSYLQTAAAETSAAEKPAPRGRRRP